VLCTYRTIINNMKGDSPFRTVHLQEIGMPMEFTIPSLRVTVLTELTYFGAVEKRLSELVELEEDWFFAGFHKKFKKAHEKSWNDKKIKENKLQERDLVFLYDSKFL